MESLRRIACTLLISALAACAQQSEGDPEGDAATPVDASDQDAASDDQPAPLDDQPAPLDEADTGLDPVDAAPDTSAPPDASAPPDVVSVDDVGSSELDTGVADVARFDVIALDAPRLDVVAADLPIARDATADAVTDATADAPTDATGDGGCASGSSLCSGVCVNHHANPSVCSGAMNLGSFCGDTSCGTLCPSTRYRTVVTRTGTTSQWFRARALECSLCGASTVARVNLTVPPGTDYDLYVYRPCSTVVGRSLNLTGMNDQVEVTESESALSDDSFDYYIEVRHVSGASCAPWTLTLEARSSGTSC